ncbi:hypothetical protein [Haloferax sulfurifontis]|uniref:Uncharacterized protein n=2 Tax=Haloferax sulfurifontis TaxID=255616 RepID=M0IKN6_9EURY|nr:hypothetical protein [Haloferax sulfurifontis]ELZ96592.1 hypothetical protein C441_04469 [Haloferax sulfurifontis ATCC BAA-897]
MARTDAARRLLLGTVVIPYMVAALAVLIVAGIPVWLLNNLWAVATGTPLLGENSRVGYYLYWAQNNLQAVVSGRGEVRWLP